MGASADTAACEPWPPGPHRPTLAEDEIHIWCADTAEVAGALSRGVGPHALLAPEELRHAARITREDRRELWMAGRATLRMLLGRYLDRAPRGIALAIGRHGKPRLLEEQRLDFNLSHSGQTMLCAFSVDGAVGVDVEFVGRRGDYSRIAHRVLGEAAAERLLALEPAAREREFLRAWTRHEAAVKCRGIGLGARESATAHAAPPWIAELDLGSRAVGAVAAERGPKRLLGWRQPAAIITLGTH